MAKAIVYKIARVVDFVNKSHADVCEDERLSLLAAARQELERMDYDDARALRDATLALQAMIEAHPLVVVDEGGA